MLTRCPCDCIPWGRREDYVACKIPAFCNHDCSRRELQSIFLMFYLHGTCSKTFEYEKGSNIEKVEQMKLMEKDLIAMAKEVERLRAEVLNAEKRAQGNQYASFWHINVC